MRKTPALTFIFLSGLAALPLRADPPAGAIWTPIPEFTDEFNGDELDQTKWQKGNPTWKGREPGWFADKNVTVKDGKLQLTMRAENLPEMTEGFKDFTCASVISRNRVRYGYFEIRAKIMASKGASAFWFYRNTPEQWTEIDVFEMCAGGSKEAGKMHTNAHVFHAPGVDKEIASPQPFPINPAPEKEFHVYGVEWDIDSIRWYLDGKLLRRLDNTYLRYSLHLLFDTETMDGWFGLPDKKTLPSTFEIDYVRGWQKR